MIPHVGVGGAIRATAIIATLFLAVGNAIFVWRPLPKQEKPLYPVPRLDLAKYSQEKEYIYAAGGYVIKPICFLVVWSVTYAPYFVPIFAACSSPCSSSTTLVCISSESFNFRS